MSTTGAHADPVMSFIDLSGVNDKSSRAAQGPAPPPLPQCSVPMNPDAVSAHGECLGPIAIGSDSFRHDSPWKLPPAASAPAPERAIGENHKDSHPGKDAEWRVAVGHRYDDSRREIGFR